MHALGHFACFRALARGTLSTGWKGTCWVTLHGARIGASKLAGQKLQPSVDGLQQSKALLAGDISRAAEPFPLMSRDADLKVGATRVGTKLATKVALTFRSAETMICGFLGELISKPGS
jgi:hypothetical protein